MQKVGMKAKKFVTAMTAYDSCANVSLVTHKFAKRSNAKSIPWDLPLGAIAGKKQFLKTRKYFFEIMSSDGTRHKIEAYGLEKITSPFKEVHLSAGDIEGLKNIPNFKPGKYLFHREKADLDLLLGMDQAVLHPIQAHVAGSLVVYKSCVAHGQKYILGGQITTQGDSDNVCCLVDSKFFSVEEFGVAPPKSCQQCRSCSECNFLMSQVSAKEQHELHQIEANLSHDPVKKKWTAKYPLTEDPKVISDTKQGCLKILGNLEKRLTKQKLGKAYEEQIKDFEQRGVISKMTPSQERSEGPGYVVPHNFVLKEGSSTTPLRLVTNSSFKSPTSGLSLNDISVKGPASLNNLLHILLRFRGYRYGFVADVKKMYHSILIHPDQKYLRRILWRDPETWGTSFQENPADVYHFNTVTFGDRPAGCCSTSSFRNTAKMNQEIDHHASETMLEDSYVDDVVSGDETMEKVEVTMKNMEKIAEHGGFQFKKFVTSGNKDEAIELFQDKEKVLGILWNPGEDMLVYQAKVNPHKRKRGKKIGPDWQPKDIHALSSQDLTKRRLLRIVNSLFDPIGIISPFTILLKIHMKMVNPYKWDENLPEDISKKWIEILGKMANFKSQVPRSILCGVSANYLSTDIVGFGDASREAFAAVVYTRFETLPGEYVCNFLTSKTRVSPALTISIPRLELLSAVLLSRLLKTVIAAMTNLKFDKVYKIVDSTSTLGMLHKQTTALQEFCGTRIGEIRRNDKEMETTVSSQWLWCAGEENPADIPSRGISDPEFISSSTWLHGPEWLQKSSEHWPTKCGKDFTAPPEEIRHLKTCLLATGGKVKDKGILHEMSKRCSNLKKLLRITALILRLFQHKGTKRGKLDKDDIMAAEKYWLREAMKLSQKNLKKGNYKSLRGYLNKAGYVVCAGRLPSQSMKIGYDKQELPILEPTHIYTKLYIKERHESLGHPGVDKIIDLTRNNYWVPNIRRTASSVWRNCITCKRIDHVHQEQLMGKMQVWRTQPAPVFNTICLDLFGPMLIRDNVIKRTGRRVVEGKCWGMVMTCAATGAINLDVTEDYSADSAIQTIRRHLCDYGTPSTVITDRGSQLKAAEKLGLDWDIITNKMSDIKWIFSPTAGHHYNGLAEIFVKRTKRTLEAVLQNSPSKMTFGELQTFLKECKQMINSRPLGPNLSSEDPESAPPLTPNHLLMGRATIEIPEGPFTETTLNKRFIFIQNLVTQWWKKWMKSVFPYLLPSYKWTNKKRNLQPGDVVLIHKEDIKRGNYQLGKISAVSTSEDNMVRKASVEYMTGQTKKVVEKAVSSLILIIPVDYRNQIE